MTHVQAIILGTIQGVTEFLPISSSGHLVVLEDFFSLEASTLLSFDIMLHCGSLLAILWYFRKSWWNFFTHLIEKNARGQYKLSQYTLAVIIGTLPAFAVGILFKNILQEYFRGTWSVVILWSIMGILLFITQKTVTKHRKISGRNALIIGIGQAFAMLPGISRSGTTIAIGLLQGIDKKMAAEFSFFLGAIAIAGASLISFMEAPLWQNPTLLILGFVSSFISSMLAVSWLMKILKHSSLQPFAYYLWAAALLTSITKFIF